MAMFCPRCAGKTKVSGTVGGESVDRFRLCLDCGFTFQTVEAATFDSTWRDHAKRAFETNTKIENYKQEVLRGLS